VKRRRLADAPQPVQAHLRELRRRLILVAAGVLAGAIGGWFLYGWLLDLLMEPLTQAGARRDAMMTLNFSTVPSSFDLKIQGSVFIGVLISCPWWIYHAWAFVAPALTRREKWQSVGFVAASVPLFLGGAYLAWRVLPVAVDLLTGFTPGQAVNLIDAESYLGFVLRFTMAFALAFLLPVVMVALTMIGLVQAATWAHGWRWAVFIAFAFAAVVSPSPDVLTMFVLALPICGLYGVAVGLAFWIERRARRRAESAASQTAG
jgi:sec-independent protein translocase protein TatC